MAPANIEATLLILDTGPTASHKDEKEKRSFFEKSRSCLCRIIERKIFSRPNDLISIVIMGKSNTNSFDDPVCENISIFSELGVPTWELIENIVGNIKPSNNKSSWMGALKVAAQFLQIEKVSHKKVVLMSDLKICPEVDKMDLENLTDTFKEKKLELIVIGPDIWMDEECVNPTFNKTADQEKSEKILKKLISDLNGITCSFEDAIEQLLFHKKKATKPMPWNADLCIGSKISIPISGYGKIRDDKIVSQWRKSYKNLTNNETIDSVTSKVSYFMKEDNTAVVDGLDVVYGFLYGQTIIPFNKMDSAMGYKSGPKCLSVFGFTKKSNVNWNNLTGDGVTYLAARKDDDNARVALDAFITTLNNLDLVGIARKVYMNNGAPHMNVLIPVIEECSKYISMINLAFKEDYRHITFPSLNKKIYAANDEQVKAIDQLINSLNLSHVDIDGKEVFSIDNCVNPTIQNFFDTLSYRALHPEEPLPQPRPEIQELLQIPEPLIKLMRDPIEAIKKKFDLVIHEKVKTGKYWVNQHLKQEDKSSEDNHLAANSTNVKLTAGSVMASQITRVGTIQPGEDFKELLLLGEPLESVCDQMIEVIERLVFQTLGNNYTKPLSALKALREKCATLNPSLFNNWIIQLKSVLLERSKIDFFKIIIEQKLGLISKTENPDSTATENNIVLFYEMQADHSKENLDDMDTTDIDNLFD